MNNTCRKAQEVLDGAGIWRAKAIALHGDWLWELKDPNLFHPRTIGWMQILRQIELAYRELLDTAGLLQRDSLYRHLSPELIYKSMLFDKQGSRKLTLSLKNRLRIWCCLRSIGKDGLQRALPGQVKGIDDPEMIEWDGVSSKADCPSCGEKDAIGFKMHKMIAEGIDLTCFTGFEGFRSVTWR